MISRVAFAPESYRCEACGHPTEEREIQQARARGERWPNERACDRRCDEARAHHEDER